MNRNEIKWKTLPIIQICEFLIKVISSDNFHFHVLILKPPLRSFFVFCRSRVSFSAAFLSSLHVNALSLAID